MVTGVQPGREIGGQTDRVGVEIVAGRVALSKWLASGIIPRALAILALVLPGRLMP